MLDKLLIFLKLKKKSVPLVPIEPVKPKIKSANKKTAPPVVRISRDVALTSTPSKTYVRHETRIPSTSNDSVSYDLTQAMFLYALLGNSQQENTSETCSKSSDPEPIVSGSGGDFSGGGASSSWDYNSSSSYDSSSSSSYESSSSSESSSDSGGSFGSD